MSRKPKTERNEAITAMRRGGLGPREIARRLALKPSVVAGVLYRAGLTQKLVYRSHSYPRDFRDRVLALAARTSQREAARIFGISQPCVSNWERASK